MLTSRSQIVLGSLLAGLIHAAALLGVALYLGYSLGPSEYSIFGMAWRYAGLVVVAIIPVWFAVRYRIVLPLVALALTTGYVLGMELIAPGPTFRDVAELEHLDEPIGIVVVENGLYIVRYMLNASIWTVGFLFLGVIEYTVRTCWGWLPSVSSPSSSIQLPVSRRQAAFLATIGGVFHAIVMLWFSLRLGLAFSGSYGWVLYVVSTGGMWILAAIPLYLLFRRQLISPAMLLTVFILLDVWSDFTASVDDLHALYFGAWCVSLAILLVAAGLEYGLRRIGVGQRLRQ